MTTLGWLVLLCWVPAVGFLAVHARAMWVLPREVRNRNLPGWAVLIMATVIAIVLTLSVFRVSFEVDLPDWIRELAFFLILLGVWTKFLGILYVRYGPAHRATQAEDDRIGAS